MKYALLALGLCWTASLSAGTVEGDVTAVDARASTVTIIAKGKPQTFRVRPDSEVLVNGAKGKLAAVVPKMRAKITGADPEVAARLEVSDPPAPVEAELGDGPARRAAIFGVKVMPTAPGAESDMAGLTRELSNSRWRMNDGKTFTLHADGTTEGNWPGARGTWKVTGPLQAEWTFSAKPRQMDQVTFPDGDANAANWKDDIGAGQTAKRVLK